MNKKQNGFTLIELMIVIAIIGIIAGIGYPAYTQKMIEVKRSEALVALQKIAQMQEEYFSRNSSYADELITLGYNKNKIESETGIYKVSIEDTEPSNCDGNNSNPCLGYTLVAKPESKAQKKDEDCASIRLDHLGRKTAKNKKNKDSKECWS